MADATLAHPAFNFPDLVMRSDGLPATPTTPEQAQARLRLLENTPEVVEILLDPRHPQNEARVIERRALHMVISGQPYGQSHDKTGGGLRNVELSEQFGANVSEIAEQAKRRSTKA